MAADRHRERNGNLWVTKMNNILIVNEWDIDVVLEHDRSVSLWHFHVSHCTIFKTTVTCSYYMLPLLSTPVPMILLTHTHTHKRTHTHTHTRTCTRTRTHSVSWYSVRLFLVTSCVDFVEWVEVIWEWGRTQRLRALRYNCQTSRHMLCFLHAFIYPCSNVRVSKADWKDNYSDRYTHTAQNACHIFTIMKERFQRRNEKTPVSKDSAKGVIHAVTSNPDILHVCSIKYFLCG